MDPLSQLLKQARRRSLIDLILDQSLLALSIAMAGAILLLLTGTSLLEWYWVAVLALASLAVGLYRFRKRVPSEYRLAQKIDWKLNLADALSTAKYFEHKHGEIVDQQRNVAEQVARTVDPRTAVPFTRSRFLIPAAGLTLVALGLFAVRYAVLNTMSLEPSLVKSAYDTFFGGADMKKQAKNNIRNTARDKDNPLDPGNPDAPTTENDQVPDSQMQSVETPDVNNSAAADQSKDAAKGQKTEEQGDNSDQGEKGEKASDGDQGNQDGKNGDKQDSGNKKEGKQDSKKGNNENSSMLDKLKDAMANMLNKMKSKPPQEGQSAQNSQDQKSGSQEKGQKSAQNQKGQQNDSSDADAQSDQQQGEQSDKKQNANAKSGDKSQDKSNSPDAKSGIGSSDGDKSAREAEQQQAMGKISEIIGKRAQNVTGEVMVEVGSTKQQLKTPWAQRQATHVEAGSEIHRDEVPLMYQQFVQQYFDEVRKGEAKQPAKP